jgi:hypothetical protein
MALTEDEKSWAWEQMATELGDEPCVDNERIADADDSEEVAAYEEAERHGCCGSMNLTLTHPTTGKTILVGCNYGH